MYYDFFGFREPPFSIAPDPRYLYLSDRHKEALAHLMYGVQGQGGFIVITGEVGTGKTTVCRCFLDNAPEHVDIALILNPRLSARELLSAVCDELEIAHDPDASIKVLVDAINADLLKAHAAGRHKVLIIDEAQNLSADVLEQLRLLTNLETAEKKLLQIVLLGQPELQDILALPELRQLNQRVTARYHLDAIDKAELPAYLQYRVSVAGLRGDLFTPAAIRKLYRASQGVPRLINLISDRALLGAYAEGDHQITALHIKRAAKEVSGGLKQKDGKPARFGDSVSHLWLVVASALIAIMGTLWVLDSPHYGVLAEPEDGQSVSGVIERVVAATTDDESVSEAQIPGESDGSVEPEFIPEQHGLSTQDAYVELFELWGKIYHPEVAPYPCQHAQNVGLECLQREGARRTLEFLDRPAILNLRVAPGQEIQVVLRALNGPSATLNTSEGPVTVSFQQIERYWFGGFRVLWRAPDYQQGGVYSDKQGQTLWISSKMMELADRYAGNEQEADRIKRLAVPDQVRWYQKLRGLTVDGIPGAMTIIQIQNDLGVDVPRLVAESVTGNS
ncbi:AAA family ATPase [Marinobacter sp. S0848L]|uniref:ExeA family protein n=1 Tax=Marinobacter sp. S0848L TaxID=2926423 RepID=UPI001FF27488|nr:AAA family ATPase [Marinobacter sp. S0848L]MCK0105527.1 AAA family ATPase [Marinobacter sp. S0848L]